MKTKSVKPVSTDVMTRQWQASSVDIKKQTRNVLKYNISSLCMDITKDHAGMNLQTQAKLLRGVVNIEYQQVHQLFTDVVDARANLGTLDTSQSTKDNEQENDLVPDKKGKDKKLPALMDFKEDVSFQQDILQNQEKIQQYLDEPQDTSIEHELVDEAAVLQATNRFVEKSNRSVDHHGTSGYIDHTGNNLDLLHTLFDPASMEMVDLEQDISMLDFTVTDTKNSSIMDSILPISNIDTSIDHSMDHFSTYTAMYANPFEDTELSNLLSENINTSNTPEELLFSQISLAKDQIEEKKPKIRRISRIDRNTQLKDEELLLLQNRSPHYITHDHGKRRKLNVLDTPFPSFTDILDIPYGFAFYEDTSKTNPIQLKWMDIQQSRIDTQLDTDDAATTMKIENFRDMDMSNVHNTDIQDDILPYIHDASSDQLEQSLQDIEDYQDRKQDGYSASIDLEDAHVVLPDNDQQVNQYTQEWYACVKNQLQKQEQTHLQQIVTTYTTTNNKNVNKLAQIQGFTNMLVLATENVIQIHQVQPYTTIYIHKGWKYRE